MTQKSLLGRRIALAETREQDVLAALFEEAGAEVVRCPMVAILDADPVEPVDAWLDRSIAGDFSHLVLYTGEGLRRLRSRAEITGREEAFIAAVGKMFRITRGPKPARALREMDLATDLPAKSPTTEGLIDAVATLELRGRRVGVQVYPGDGPERLLTTLRSAGAEPEPVCPYRYAPRSDADAVARLIRALALGKIDVLCFTSASQVDRLWEVAKGEHLLDELARGMGNTKVAAVGPVVREAVLSHGHTPDIEPDGPYFLKPLVRSVIEAMGQ